MASIGLIVIMHQAVVACLFSTLEIIMCEDPQLVTRAVHTLHMVIQKISSTCSLF